VEADTARPRQPVLWGHPMDTQVDPNPFLGRVAYTHGLSLDQPLGVVRMGCTTRLDTLNRMIGSAPGTSSRRLSCPCGTAAGSGRSAPSGTAPSAGACRTRTV
jgi:hypothetical protein